MNSTNKIYRAACSDNSSFCKGECCKVDQTSRARISACAGRTSASICYTQDGTGPSWLRATRTNSAPRNAARSAKHVHFRHRRLSAWRRPGTCRTWLAVAMIAVAGVLVLVLVLAVIVVCVVIVLKRRRKKNGISITPSKANTSTTKSISSSKLKTQPAQSSQSRFPSIHDLRKMYAGARHSQASLSPEVCRNLSQCSRAPTLGNASTDSGSKIKSD